MVDRGSGGVCHVRGGEGRCERRDISVWLIGERKSVEGKKEDW